MLGRPSLPSLDILLHILYSRECPSLILGWIILITGLQFPAGTHSMVLVGADSQPQASAGDQIWLLGELLPAPTQ